MTLLNAAQTATAQVNPFVAMRFTTMDEMLGESIATERFRATLVAAFSVAAILLAVFGIYSTVSYSVAHRTFEIGIRMSFGASRGSIFGSVLRHSLLLGGTGALIGFGSSLLFTRLIAGMLAGIRPADPLSLIASATLLITTASGAALMPAMKAARVNPNDAQKAV